MKTNIKNPIRRTALMAALGLMLAGRVTAQDFTNLHSFADYPSEGVSPVGRLLLSGNILYGTTAGGGSDGYGTVFKVHVNGTGFTNLYSFTGTSNPLTNSAGASPRAGLALSGNTLYGTASRGGIYGNGTVFTLNTDGTGFTTLHGFDGSDGMNPVAGVILSGNILYGTTRGDGENVFGAVFAINTDGTGFTNLHIFGGDGIAPLAGVVLSGNTLYGTTQGGGGGPGGAGNGSVFAVNTDGSGFTNLYTFTGTTNGAFPYGGLVLSGDTLYGTTFGANFGDPRLATPSTVFRLNTNGTGFTTLHRFNLDFSEGFYPTAGLGLSGDILYGTTYAGGSPLSGTVFAIHTHGTGFTTLYDFTALPDAGGPPYTNSGGAYPWGDLILAGNTLYGTASQGGSFGAGTVFSLSLPALPQLTITRLGANVVLTWSTSFVGFALQSTTNDASSNSWSPVAQPTKTNHSLISVTVPIAAGSKFFRLHSR